MNSFVKCQRICWCLFTTKGEAFTHAHMHTCYRKRTYRFRHSGPDKVRVMLFKRPSNNIHFSRPHVIVNKHCEQQQCTANPLSIMWPAKRTTTCRQGHWHRFPTEASWRRRCVKGLTNSV